MLTVYLNSVLPEARQVTEIREMGNRGVCIPNKGLIVVMQYCPSTCQFSFVKGSQKPILYSQPFSLEIHILKKCCKSNKVKTDLVSGPPKSGFCSRQADHCSLVDMSLFFFQITVYLIRRQLSYVLNPQEAQQLFLEIGDTVIS